MASHRFLYNNSGFHVRFHASALWFRQDKKRIFCFGVRGYQLGCVDDSMGWPLNADVVLMGVSDDRAACDGFRLFCHARVQAMEQQTLSVAKAGLVCKLNARTTVFAVTNTKVLQGVLAWFREAWTTVGVRRFCFRFLGLTHSARPTEGCDIYVQFVTFRTDKVRFALSLFFSTKRGTCCRAAFVAADVCCYPFSWRENVRVCVFVFVCPWEDAHLCLCRRSFCRQSRT